MKSTIMLNVAGPMFGLGLLLLAVGVLAASNVEQQQRTNSELITLEVNAMLAVEELYIVIRDIRHELNLYLRTHDPRNLENIRGLLKHARQPIEVARKLSRTQTESELISTVEEGCSDFERQFATFTGPDHSINDSELSSLNDSYLEQHIFDPIRKCIGHNRDVVDRTTSAGAATARQMRIGFLLLGVTGSVAGLVFGLGIARSITRSFVQLDVSVRSVAGKLKGAAESVQISHFGDLQGLEVTIRELEDEIGKVVEQLQMRELEVLRSEQLAIVGQLAAGVAHELRNPLMPVKVLVQASLEEGPDGVLSGERLRIVNDEILRLEQTIKQFLEFARPPALEACRTDLRDVIRRSEELVLAQAQRQKIHLETLLPEMPVYCIVDAPQLRQVILNLLLNAFDAVSDGGKVVIALRHVHGVLPEQESLHDAMRLRPGVAAGRAEITVTDSGAGLQTEVLARVFQPFVTTKETGTGLGLSICQRIVQAHGGTIHVTNIPGGGAQFRIQLPCSG